MSPMTKWFAVLLLGISSTLFAESRFVHTDGRNLVFTSDRSGHNQIFIISADGTNEHRITVDSHNYFKARWSPYLN